MITNDEKTILEPPKRKKDRTVLGDLRALLEFPKRKRGKIVLEELRGFFIIIDTLFSAFQESKYVIGLLLLLSTPLYLKVWGRGIDDKPNLPLFLVSYVAFCGIFILVLELLKKRQEKD